MEVVRWIKQGDERSGPFNESELRRLAADGRLRPDALLSVDGEEWVRAGRFAGLFPAARLRDAPPPLPAKNTAARTAASPDSRAPGALGAEPAAVSAAAALASAELLPVEAPPVPAAAHDVAPPPKLPAIAIGQPKPSDPLSDVPLGERLRQPSDLGLTPRTRGLLAAALGGVALGLVGTGLAWSLGFGAGSRAPEARLASAARQPAAGAAAGAAPVAAVHSPAKPSAPATVATDPVARTSTVARKVPVTPADREPAGSVPPVASEIPASRANPASPDVPATEPVVAAASGPVAGGATPAASETKPAPPNMPDPTKPANPGPAPAPAMAQPAAGPPKMAAAGNPNPNANNNMKPAAPGMPQGPPPAANDRGRRRMLVLGNGGTPESEAAVEAALAWLAAHQMTDGGWSFDHTLSACGGQCANPGVLSDARNAATAMALLPFLAAGYSHEDGPYKNQIWAGLAYLIGHMGADGSLWEPGGTMYSQGLATTALCDAYNLCADRPTSEHQPNAGPAVAAKRDPKAERAARLENARLAKAQRATLINKAQGKLPGAKADGAAAGADLPAGARSAGTDGMPDEAQLRKLRTLQLGVAAQKALDFIVGAQNSKTGGWRYLVGEQGDTSVVGWQLMALKAGHLADLRVPQQTLAAASMFLDAVQLDYGAEYGYTSPLRGTPATTAIGLLARQNLGWDASNPALQRGAQLLAVHGPSPDDMYFNFYADQVLRNLDGPLWQQWNPVMRDYLVKNQEKLAHAAGSWMFVGMDRHAAHGTQMGGRLYNTALCTLILQVYYRHDPVYSRPTTYPRASSTPRSAVAPSTPRSAGTATAPAAGEMPGAPAMPAAAANAP